MRRERYDGAELRRRMTVCLSASELRALGEEHLGASIEGARGDVVARELVKHFEAGAGLSTLVEHLRVAKPLVEWTDAEPDDVVTPPTAPPSPVEAPSQPRDEPPAESAVPDEAPRWIPPGHVDPSRPAEPESTGHGTDPRILLAVAALTVLAAVVAFAAGRAAGPASAETTTAHVPDKIATGTGPAARAARAIARGFAGVTRACELDDPGERGVAALALAYERCGAPSPTERATRPAREPSEPREANPASPDANPVPAETRRARPTAQVPACVGGCDAKHASCKQSCGAEPTEGSKYAFFQACLTKCLTEGSKCRVACEP